MLSDHKFQALGEIERRLGWDSRESTRFFSTVEPPSTKSRRKRARARMLVAAAVFAGMVLIGPRMLTEAEIEWWNAYHARVLEVLAPQLEGDDLAWLEKACEPL